MRFDSEKVISQLAMNITLQSRTKQFLEPSRKVKGKNKKMSSIGVIEAIEKDDGEYDEKELKPSKSESIGYNIDKKSNLVQYIKPLSGSDLQTFSSIIEGQIQKKFKAFIKSYNLDFSESKYITLIKNPTDEVIKHINMIGEIVFKTPESVIVKTEENVFTFSISSDYMSDIYVTSYSNSIETSKKGITHVLKKFKGILSQEKVNMELRWYYNSEPRGIRNSYITEELNDEFHPESYPYLDIDKIIDDYIKSDEPILILIGPPGTGKTRLIRQILKKRHEDSGSVIVSFTSDQHVIENSEIFVDYILGTADTLIIEDIDYHLKSRTDGNAAAMYNFLTASNSILVNHVKKKKIIFSTNLSDSKNIDEALLRPGRCFKIIETRFLTLEEAGNLMKILNKDEVLQSKNFTVAEIYNSRSKPTVKRVGF